MSERSIQWFAGITLAAFTALWFARWPSFPVMLDPYYHVLVAEQVRAAGGPIVYEWWQAAPGGRPHVYPPLLHMLLAAGLSAGATPLTVLRVATALIVPAVMASVYCATRRLAGSLAALMTLWTAMAGFSTVLQLGVALAAGLALILLLWLAVAMVEGRAIAAAGLFGLLWYTHLGMPIVALASMAIWLVLSRCHDPRRFAALGGGLLLGLPWIWHVLRYADALRVGSRYENATVELLVVAYVLAAYGAWRCWRNGFGLRMVLSLAIGCCAMAATFAYRWLSGEGMIGIALLAGVGIAALVARLWDRGPSPLRPLVVGLAGGLILLSPVAVVSGGGVRWRWLDTTPMHLLNWPGVQPKPTDSSLSTPVMARTVEAVAIRTRPGDILWSNAAYAGGLVAAFANRALSTTMFYEMPPAREEDPVAAAQWILWFNHVSDGGAEAVDRLVRRYQLQPVWASELARLYWQPGERPRAAVPRGVIPLWSAGMLLCSVLGLVVWNFRKDQAWGK